MSIDDMRSLVLLISMVIWGWVFPFIIIYQLVRLRHAIFWLGDALTGCVEEDDPDPGDEDEDAQPVKLRAVAGGK